MDWWTIKPGWKIEIPNDYKDYLDFSVGDAIRFEVFDDGEGKRGLLVIKDQSPQGQAPLSERDEDEEVSDCHYQCNPHPITKEMRCMHPDKNPKYKPYVYCIGLPKCNLKVSESNLKGEVGGQRGD